MKYQMRILQGLKLAAVLAVALSMGACANKNVGSDAMASAASSGIHPGTNARQAALPSAPAKPAVMMRAMMKKLATFEPDAMNAATGVGAP